MYEWLRSPECHIQPFCSVGWMDRYGCLLCRYVETGLKPTLPHLFWPLLEMKPMVDGRLCCKKCNCCDVFWTSRQMFYLAGSKKFGPRELYHSLICLTVQLMLIYAPLGVTWTWHLSVSLPFFSFSWQEGVFWIEAFQTTDVLTCINMLSMGCWYSS